MSWYSKVHWAEGVFLKPQHFQQGDRYHERLLQTRVQRISPYPWGFSALEIDRDLALQSRFGLRRATGIMPDGTPFDLPADGPLPEPVDIQDTASKQIIWLTLPVASVNTREAADLSAESAARYFPMPETFIDSTADLTTEGEIDVAHLRLAFEVRKTPKPGYANLGIARILEVRDRTVLLDDKYIPPVLTTSSTPQIDGWIDRVIGWVETKIEELARYAADVSAGGGLQNVDYLILQMLNRTLPVMQHFRRSTYVHPERLYEEFLRLAGELATFGSSERRAARYPAYDQDDLENVFAPVITDIQDFLAASQPRRAIRLEIVERAQNAFISVIRDRSLFRTASFVLEVSAARPLTEIQSQFPRLFKIGPNTKMNEIVNTNLPGVPLVHMPTPPPQIRALTDHVYFYFDKTSPLWPEFSVASSIGFHFSGDWPGLGLELWAILDTRR